MNPDVERLKTLAETPVHEPSTASAPEASVEAPQRRPPSINAEQLVALAKKSDLHLFHDQYQESFAWVVVQDSRLSLKIQSKRFQQWLVRLVWVTLKKAPSRETVQTAIQILAASARYDGPQYELGTRVIRTKEAIWYDLGNNVVRIIAAEWSIVPEPYPLFLRYPHQRPQVVPIPGGDLRDLLQFINLPGRDSTLSADQLLLLITLVLMMVPDIAHPVLCIHAEQGAGKTTMMRMLRELIDPSATPTLAPPDSLREFVQQAAHHYLVFLDNLSTLPEWLSDTICRCVTGEGFSKRELFSDDEDILYSFRRSIGLNGINLVPSKPDLLDRSLILSLERIPDTHRKTDTELWETFHALRPKLLGAIFTLLGQVLVTVATVRIARAPRLADFAKYGAATATALGVGQTVFLAALRGNSEAQTSEALQASPVAQALLFFLEDKSTWSGPTTQLLAELNKMVDQVGVDPKSRLWPKDARWVWRRINEVRSNLLAAGWQATHREGAGRSHIEFVRRPSENDRSVPGDTDHPQIADDQLGNIFPNPLDTDSSDVTPKSLDSVACVNTGDSRIIFSSSTGLNSTGWPIQLPGLGLQELGKFEHCHLCAEGTWSHYGGRPLCKRHALEVFARQEGSQTCSEDYEGGNESGDDQTHEKGEHGHG